MQKDIDSILPMTEVQKHANNLRSSVYGKQSYVQSTKRSTKIAWK